MKQHKLKYPVEMMSKILDVSTSGYYNWLKSGPSDRWLENRKIIELIEDIFEESHQSYGSPRMSVELENKGYKVSRPRTARNTSVSLYLQLYQIHGMRRFTIQTYLYYNFFYVKRESLQAGHQITTRMEYLLALIKKTVLNSVGHSLEIYDLNVIEVYYTLL